MLPMFLLDEKLDPVEIFGVQVMAVIIIFNWTAFFTFLICKFIDVTIGINITLKHEKFGLDKIEHGETAMNL